MKRYMFALLCAILISSIAPGLLAGDPPAPEFRGIWVDAFHDGFKTPEQTTEMVNKVADANLNAIFVQVRKRGDAYYNSKIVPKAKDIAPDYDPLADIITKAHAKGIEVHAWVVPFCVWQKCYTSIPGHVFTEHPDWLSQTDHDTIYAYGNKVYLDTGLPEVRDHIVAVVREIVENYAVDGIHLDRPCYPYQRMGYNARAVELFNAEYKRTGKPEYTDPDWCAWRLEQVNALAKSLSDTIRSTKRNVKITVTVENTRANSLRDMMCDWGTLTSRGYVDALVPMNFFDDDQAFSEYMDQAVSSAEGKHAYIGVGAWRQTAEVSAKQLTAIRSKGGPGFVLYGYAYMTKPDESGATLLGSLKTLSLAEKTTTPAMGWK